MKDLMKKYFEEIEIARQKVSSPEYLDWLFGILESKGQIDDESALYLYEGNDSENGQILSSFINYLQEIAQQQGVLVVSDKECRFHNEEVFFTHNNQYYLAYKMFGQGVLSSVSVLDEKPEQACVQL